MIETIFISFLLTVMAWCAGMLLRNNMVCNVRVDFIYSDDYPHGYHSLPSHSDMLYLPKYWLLWSTQDWRAWLRRQQEKSTSKDSPCPPGMCGRSAECKDTWCPGFPKER